MYDILNVFRGTLTGVVILSLASCASPSTVTPEEAKKPAYARLQFAMVAKDDCAVRNPTKPNWFSRVFVQFDASRQNATGDLDIVGRQLKQIDSVVSSSEKFGGSRYIRAEYSTDFRFTYTLDFHFLTEPQTARFNADGFLVWKPKDWAKAPPIVKGWFPKPSSYAVTCLRIDDQGLT